MTDQMAPEHSPRVIAGTRRVNNRPMYIVGAIMVAFLAMMAVVATDRGKKHENDQVQKTAEPGGGNTTMTAKTIVGAATDGIVPPVQEPPKIPVVHPDLDKPPLPPGAAALRNSAPPSPRTPDDRERIRQVREQQFFDAVKAKTTVPAGIQRGASAGSGGARLAVTPAVDPREEIRAKLAALRQETGGQTRAATDVYKEKLAELRSAGLIGGSGSGGGAPDAARLVRDGGNDRNDLGQFDSHAGLDRWRLGTTVEAPRTPYQVRAGFVLPGILISGINSDLAGEIMAQVSQDVYDTPTGRHLLVPQGSRLVGSYSSQVAFGQSRVLIAWQRIVFPDGKAIDIGAMPGADSAGFAGFTDEVNNHYTRVFTSAFLLSAITAGAELSQGQAQTTSQAPNATSTLSTALGQQLGQTSSQLIQKNLNVAPTIEIRPGYRFNIIVVKDLDFAKPYHGFDY